MSAAVPPGNASFDPTTKSTRVVVPLDALDEPGTYICNWSGQLLRVPEGNLDETRFAILSDTEARPWTLTKISADPNLPRSAARTLADQLGLHANF
jgi:hypothetical protein